jgi:hypothetical protein
MLQWGYNLEGCRDFNAAYAVARGIALQWGYNLEGCRDWSLFKTL